MTSQRKSVGILIFDEVEVLDFCGPFEVFSVTRLTEENRRETLSPFEVHLIAERMNPIVTTGGMRVLPQFTLEDSPKLDVLVIPGGWGTRREMHNEGLLNWIRSQSRQVERITSVCTGALLLGSAKLLDGHRATTHWRALDLMRETFPHVTVEDNLHVVEDGKLITSAGISAGIEMALLVVKQYFGEAIARRTAQYMEYAYPEDNARRVQVAS